MDLLTHTATGLFLGRAGLKRWTPLATPILLLAANAPDIDVVSLFGGPLNYLHYHRHLTHSLTALPVMALLTVLVVRVLARKPVRWAGALAAAGIGVASHLALDWTNPYGIRLWLPFSAEWLRGDLTSLVDLWIWVAMLLGVAGPFLGRLVGSEIVSGPASQKHHGRGFAWFALAFLLLYNCGRAALHARAAATLDARIYQGAEPLSVAAMPHPANPWRWKGLVEASDFYAVAEVNLADDFDPARAQVFHKPEPDPALHAARATPAFQEFLRFAQFPLWRVSPAPEQESVKIVQLLDLRFGTPAAPGMMVTAVVSADRQVAETRFQWGPLLPR
jgi:inner membrane protein